MFTKKLIACIAWSVLLIAASCTVISAQDLTVQNAKNVTEWSSVTSSGFDLPYNITDSNDRTWATSSGYSSVNISYSKGVGSLYLVFDRIPEQWTLKDTDTGRTQSCGTNGFLHEFVNIMDLFGYLPANISLEFPAGASIDEVYVFSEGEVPEWVQIWESPCERADLLLLSSHSDDEQLFFAGILPYYAGEMGLNVQVVYLINHFDVHDRPHEQLDGLWTVGVKNYPVISDFPDLYSESLDGALNAFSTAGYKYDDFVSYITENIRRFKPLVIVSHDVNGEYGHGTHILCAKALTESIDFSEDETKYPESAARYGAWEPLKCYLHLYPENPIVMDWDKPLEKFGGLSAFQVTQKGFDCHDSQQWTWFNAWIDGADGNPIMKASHIQTYSPCNYGLYKSSVGYDTVGGDFFENVQTYDEQNAAKESAEFESDVNAVDETAAKTAGDDGEKSPGVYDTVKQFVTEHSRYVLTVAVMTAVMILLVVLVVNHPQKDKRRKY